LIANRKIFDAKLKSFFHSSFCRQFPANMLSLSYRADEHLLLIAMKFIIFQNWFLYVSCQRFLYFLSRRDLIFVKNNPVQTQVPLGTIYYWMSFKMYRSS
jgi:hypothetical protein